MKQALLLVAGLALGLQACVKADSVDSAGNCKQSFLGDYNNVNHEYRAVEDVKSLYRSDSESARVIFTEKYQALKNACDRFYMNHSNVSCKADRNGGTTQVGHGDLRLKCDEANAYLFKPVTTVPAATPVPTIAPTEPIGTVDGYQYLRDIQAYQIELNILDTYQVGKLTKNPKYIAINGGVGTPEWFANSLNVPNATYCKLTEKTAGAWLALAQQTRFVQVIAKNETADYEKETRSLSWVLGAGSIGITCVKLSSTPFLLKDVRSALRTIIDVSVQK